MAVPKLEALAGPAATATDGSAAAFATATCTPRPHGKRAVFRGVGHMLGRASGANFWRGCRATPLLPS